MANGFERLEKFFSSKRKASAVSTAPSTAPSSTPSSPLTPSTDMSFPSPSFIRPKTSRMAAREERRVRQAASNSSFTAEDFSPVRNGSTKSDKSDRTAAERRIKAARPRSSSLDTLHRDHLAAVFRGFEFPRPPPSRNGDNELPWPSFGSKPLPQLPKYLGSRPCSPFKVDIPLPMIETPPSSDPEDSPIRQARGKPQKLQIPPFHSLPTPEASPEFGPVADWQLQENKTVDVLDEALCQEIHQQLEATFFPVQPGENSGLPGLAPSAFPHDLPSPSASLSEPDFDEFFTLSDDSVAEFQPDIVHSGLKAESPVTMASSAQSLPLRHPPLLALEPPSASRPAAAGAFEAARIASRYQFDMLYAVNLWPKDADNVSAENSDEAHELRPLTGRLLAAYGLHNGPSPFQIAADVHGTILRSEGWLEYRDEQAMSDGFSRAYARAFYPGQFKANRAIEDKTSTSPCRESNDRGIVFAAYRKPNPDGSVRYSSPDELARLERDVGTMVDVLIDVHVASQLRQPPLSAQYGDDVGPIPQSGRALE